MKLTKALEIYLNYQEVSGSSKKSLIYYKQNIGYFIDFTEDVDVDKITTDIYNDFVIFLRNKNVVNNNKEKPKKLAPDTIRTRLQAVKSFFNYLYKQGYKKENIFEGVRNFKCGKKVITILSPSQITDIINYYDSNCFIRC